MWCRLVGGLAFATLVWVALVWNWCGWFTILGFLCGLGDSVCLYCLIAGGMMSFDSLEVLVLCGLA